MTVNPKQTKFYEVSKVMQYTEASTKSFLASAALGANLRVRLSSGKLVLASSTENELGTTERPAFAVDDDTPVRLRTAQGTAVMVAAGAIGAGVDVFAANNGQVAATGTIRVGNNMLIAATAAGDFIEVLRA